MTQRLKYLFESSVIYEGTKTLKIMFQFHKLFESSVIYEGTKTLRDTLM